MGVEYDKEGRALSRPYRELVLERAGLEPEYRCGLVAEGVQCLLNGEIEVGRNLLRDGIDADLGVKGLAALAGQTVESIAWMFGRGGNPGVREFFEAVHCIGRREGVELEVRVVRVGSGDGGRRGRGRYTRSRRPRTMPIAEYRARGALADYYGRKSLASEGGREG